MKKSQTDPEACTSDIMAMLDTIDILGGKWTLVIVHYLLLREGYTNTFKKMENDIGSISAKVLSKELKILEVNKIVHREVMLTKPITVQYSITEYGKELKYIINVMVAWGQKHRSKMFGHV